MMEDTNGVKKKRGPEKYHPDVFRTNYTFRLNKAERDKIKFDSLSAGFRKVSKYIRNRLGLD